MENRGLFNWKDLKLYLIIMGCLILVIAYYQPILAIIWAGVLAYLIYRYNKIVQSKEREWIKYIEGLSEEFDSTIKHAIFNMPFPLVMVEIDGTISWYNTRFLNMIAEKDLLNKKIENLVPKFKIEDILKKEDEKPLFLEYNDKYYEVHYNIVEIKKTVNNKENIIILYWVDKTEAKKLSNKCKDEKLSVCLAYIDNYDEVKSTTPEVNRPLVLAEIDKILSAYTAENNGFIRKYENDKYLLIFQNRDLEVIESKKFDILDRVREIDMGNTIAITLSMGVGKNGKNPNEAYEYARAAIDIGLGRGGDQAVVKEESNLSFYGGKTKAIEKRNKVRSRVISHALRQLIDQSEKIFIMGHKNADMDSFGAGIGLIRAVKNRNKKAYLVLDGPNPSIRNIYNRMIAEEPEYLNSIISPEEAIEKADKNSLLVIVDNHKTSFTEEPELLKLIDKKIIIDHHRRGAEFIEDPVLTYLEPYASSTCELVTEILYYMSDKMEMTKFDADALLAGITVDTKNFTFQTGVRTFEAASILKRAGADTTSVRELFKDDHNTFLNRAEVVKGSKIVFGKVAIGIFNRDLEDSILIAAQAANELLNINGIEASFVLTLANGKVHISGRSLGNISVQLILEKLGGGGHLTSAGTQLESVSIEEAEKMLVNAIDEYFKEGETE
ncbi:MAG: phosphoesterase [Tissierellia bacterium]|nr:phosphoesterase [Tissierellia bacterium]